MKLVGFQFEHLELFDWRPDEQKMYNVGSEFVNMIISMNENGECYTAMHDGRILVIGGIIRQSQKTGYAFTLFSRHAEIYPVAAARLVKRMFDQMRQSMGLHRITTFNLEDQDMHHRWVEWLGFRFEGVIEKYDDEGGNYYQYGLVT